MPIMNKYLYIHILIQSLYNRLFKNWLKNFDIEGEKNVLFCCDELRTMRKKLIAVYFFDKEYQL